MMDLHISADHVFIACGYTDMRKSIDGLSAIVTQQFHLNPFQPALFLFVAVAGTGSRPCFGKETVSCSFTNGLKRPAAMAEYAG